MYKRTIMKMKNLPSWITPLKILAYLKASVLNTLLGVISLWLIFRITNNDLITIFLATFIGYFYSIYNYNRIGFKRKERPPYKRFAIAYFVTFTLNYSLTLLLTPFLHEFYIVQLIVVPLVALIQWIILNLWAFRRHDY